jgi:diamine N-acetyltransferase
MSILRALKFEDAKYMMEYIQDKEISNNFRFTKKSCSLDGFKIFIQESWTDKTNIHFAIEDDEYVGTVSLKNINSVDRNAEYAIIIRKKYWGTGIAKDATRQIINYGFNTLNLKKIYLNVFSSNIRANKFYKNMGFKFEGTFKEHIYVNERYEDLNWYCTFNEIEEDIS